MVYLVRVNQPATVSRNDFVKRCMFSLRTQKSPNILANFLITNKLCFKYRYTVHKDVKITSRQIPMAYKTLYFHAYITNFRYVKAKKKKSKSTEERFTCIKYTDSKSFSSKLQIQREMLHCTWYTYSYPQWKQFSQLYGYIHLNQNTVYPRKTSAI